jgi:hypothetical protein
MMTMKISYVKACDQRRSKIFSLRVDPASAGFFLVWALEVAVPAEQGSPL